MHPISARLAAPHSTTLERYQAFLGTEFTSDEGKVRQPASARFIRFLGEVHAERRPKFDLDACLAGGAEDFTGRVWFWSDLHLFHKNIIPYTGRPFEDVDGMNDTLMRNCLEHVAPGDILIFGGDITMGSVTATNELLQAIPCYKINVLGNHDIERKGKRLALAVDEVAAYLELSVRGVSVLVTHYPVSDLILAPGQINLHGHIHNTELHPSLGDGSRHINMSVEHTGFAPASLDELLAKVARPA